MNKGTKRGAKLRSYNGANNSTYDVKEEIIAILKDSEIPFSTSDLASKLKKAWHTIDRACLMLQIDNRVEGFKIGKMNLWKIKKQKRGK